MDKSPLSVQRIPGTSTGVFYHPHARHSRLFECGGGSPSNSKDSMIKYSRKRTRSDEEDDQMDSRGSSSGPLDSSNDNGGGFGFKKRSNGGLTKRLRMDENRRFPLAKLLDTMEKPQLVSLLTKLIESNTSVAQDLASSIPRPTVSSAETILYNLESKLQDSFPYTKWGPSRDDYSFNRVRGILNDLIETILDLASHFTSSDEHASMAFMYLHYATSLAHRLPRWENPIHQRVNIDLYTKLGEYWKRAIIEAGHHATNEGKIYGANAVTEWAKNLMFHHQECGGLYSDVVTLFVEKLGWIVGMNEVPHDHCNDVLKS